MFCLLDVLAPGFPEQQSLHSPDWPGSPRAILWIASESYHSWVHLFIHYFWDRVSQYCLDGLGTHSVNQIDLKLRDLQIASAFLVMGLKGCTTIANWCPVFLHQCFWGKRYELTPTPPHAHYFIAGAMGRGRGYLDPPLSGQRFG